MGNYHETEQLLHTYLNKSTYRDPIEHESFGGNNELIRISSSSLEKILKSSFDPRNVREYNQAISKFTKLKVLYGEVVGHRAIVDVLINVINWYDEKKKELEKRDKEEEERTAYISRPDDPPLPSEQSVEEENFGTPMSEQQKRAEEERAEKSRTEARNKRMIDPNIHNIIIAIFKFIVNNKQDVIDKLKLRNVSTKESNEYFIKKIVLIIKDTFDFYPSNKQIKILIKQVQQMINDPLFGYGFEIKIVDSLEPDLFTHHKPEEFLDIARYIFKTDYYNNILIKYIQNKFTLDRIIQTQLRIANWRRGIIIKRDQEAYDLLEKQANKRHDDREDWYIKEEEEAFLLSLSCVSSVEEDEEEEEGREKADYEKRERERARERAEANRLNAKATEYRPNRLNAKATEYRPKNFNLPSS